MEAHVDSWGFALMYTTPVALVCTPGDGFRSTWNVEVPYVLDGSTAAAGPAVGPAAGCPATGPAAGAAMGAAVGASGTLVSGPGAATPDAILPL